MIKKLFILGEGGIKIRYFGIKIDNQQGPTVALETIIYILY